ncbi:hypothetical protein HK102_013691, partial [Quaeritorhiza haematococci]
MNKLKNTAKRASKNLGFPNLIISPSKRFLIPTHHSPVEDDRSEIVFNKESFERVLTDPELFDEFKEYAEADYCLENILFYESLMELEEVLCQNIPSYAVHRPSRGYALDRFLRRLEITSDSVIN